MWIICLKLECMPGCVVRVQQMTAVTINSTGDWVSTSSTQERAYYIAGMIDDRG